MAAVQLCARPFHYTTAPLLCAQVAVWSDLLVFMCRPHGTGQADAVWNAAHHQDSGGGAGSGDCSAGRGPRGRCRWLAVIHHAQPEILQEVERGGVLLLSFPSIAPSSSMPFPSLMRGQ